MTPSTSLNAASRGTMTSWSTTPASSTKYVPLTTEIGVLIGGKPSRSRPNPNAETPAISTTIITAKVACHRRAAPAAMEAITDRRGAERSPASVDSSVVASASIPRLSTSVQPTTTSLQSHTSERDRQRMSGAGQQVSGSAGQRVSGSAGQRVSGSEGDRQIFETTQVDATVPIDVPRHCRVGEASQERADRNRCFELRQRRAEAIVGTAAE